MEKLTLITSGQEGTDQGVIEACNYLGILPSGYTMNKNSDMKECFGSQKNCDILNIDQSDIMIVFMMSNEKINDDEKSRVFSCLNYVISNKYDSIPIVQTKDIMYFETEQKSIIVLWDINNNKILYYADKLYKFLIKNKPANRIMFLGPTNENFPEIDELIQDLVLKSFDMYLNPKSYLKRFIPEKKKETFCPFCKKEH